jgi:hypothetical protein
MTTWHAHDDVLARYVAGDVDDVLASSIEAHLILCARCRARLASHVPAARVSAGWATVVATIDAPRPGLLERLLVRIGTRPGTARLLAATPTIRLSWLASTALAAGFAAASAARPAATALLFLVLAPLVPVAGVAIAFSRSLDPMADVADATPTGGLPLLLIRTIAAVVPSTVVAILAGVLLPAVDGSWLVWLLPALALSTLSLLLGSVVSIEHAATALGALWAAGVVVTEAMARGSLRALRAGGSAESVLFDAPGQLLAALITILAFLAMAASAGRTAELRRYR